MLIGKAELASLIPHAGAMCLLDGVLSWDDECIVCISDSHRDPFNPLRYGGRLSALHAFEYGAQAVAVHGALMALAGGEVAPPGFLAALRNGRLQEDYLDDIEASLQVSAHKLLAGGGSYVYAARVETRTRCLAEVRVTIATTIATRSV